MAVYDITIEVLDPSITPLQLRSMVSDIGEVLELKPWKSGDVDAPPPSAADSTKTESN